MARLKNALYRHRYFLCVFAFILLYEYLAVLECRLPQVGEVAYAFHSIDFSMGFAGYMLPGGVFRALFPDAGRTALVVYETLLLTAFFFALALFLERLLLRTAERDRPACAVLLFLFLTGPCTFSIFVTDLGIQEVYWVFLAGAFFLCLAYRPLQPLAPVLCALALLVNYAAIICYVPFFCIMLLYRLSRETEKRARTVLLVSFCLCVAVSLPLFVWLAGISSSHMKITLDEYNEVLRARDVREFTYVDSLIYGRYETELAPDVTAVAERFPFYRDPTEATTLLGFIVNIAVVRFAVTCARFAGRDPLRNIVPFLLIAPVVIVIFRYCFSQVRDRAAGRLRRFVFFCVPALFFVTLLCAWPVSFDFFKWMCYAFLPLFAAFVYMAYCEGERVFAFLRRALSPVPAPAVLLYASLYGLVVLEAYY